MKHKLILSILIMASLAACSQSRIAVVLSSTPNPAEEPSINSTLTPTVTPTLSPTATPSSSTPIPLNGKIVFTSISRIHNSISLLNPPDGNILSVNGLGSDAIAWSPDGAWIAFNGGIPPAQNQGVVSQLVDLFIIKPNGSDYKRLTQSSQGKGDVNWSPDGKLLVYTYTNHTQPSDLAIFDIDGQATYLLSNTTGYESHPAWSPNGQQIAYLYTEDIDQPSELWLMNANSKTSQRILDFELAPSRIDWSPDGQWIAFVSAENSQPCGNIYIVASDGTDLTQLTDLGGCALSVVWSPNGRNLAFIERKDFFNNFQEWQSQIGIMDISSQSRVTVTIEETWRINDIDWQPIQ